MLLRLENIDLELIWKETNFKIKAEAETIEIMKSSNKRSAINVIFYWKNTGNFYVIRK